jgi:hypothetical protein
MIYVKTCTKCFRTLPEDRFELRSDRGKRRTRCRQCQTMYARAWRKANPEAFAETRRKYRQKLREQPEIRSRQNANQRMRDKQKLPLAARSKIADIQRRIWGVG